MTIEQTIEIPADHRVFFEFFAPQEIPEGLARVELKVTPVIETQEPPSPKNVNATATASPTPISDSLLGILEGMGPIDLDEMRTERILSKHAKHLL